MEHFKVKTWRINNPFDITEADLLWLQNNCSRVEYDSRIQMIPGSNNLGQLSQMQIIAPVLKCVTNSSKQETMLQLKFGDRLILESWVNCTSTHSYV